MHVDPAELRTLAAALYQAGTTIDGIAIRSALSEDHLPGCGVFSAVREAGEFTEGAYLHASARRSIRGGLSRPVRAIPRVPQ